MRGMKQQDPHPQPDTPEAGDALSSSEVAKASSPGLDPQHHKQLISKGKNLCFNPYCKGFQTLSIKQVLPVGLKQRPKSLTFNNLYPNPQMGKNKFASICPNLSRGS